MATLTLKTKSSHIATVRKASQSVNERIQTALGWSHAKYCNHQFQQYLLFVDRFCSDTPKMRNNIRYSSVFRGFWCNEWVKRNELHFLPSVTTENDESLVPEYLYINSYFYLLKSPEFMYKYDSLLQLINT